MYPEFRHLGQGRRALWRFNGVGVIAETERLDGSDHFNLQPVLKQHALSV
jgi:hypothetical protein